MLKKLISTIWTLVVGKFTPDEKERIAEFTKKAAEFAMANAGILVEKGMEGAAEGFAKELKNHDT